jgi:hypothetical protein
VGLQGLTRCFGLGEFLGFGDSIYGAGYEHSHRKLCMLQSGNPWAVFIDQRFVDMNAPGVEITLANVAPAL